MAHFTPKGFKMVNGEWERTESYTCLSVAGGWQTARLNVDMTVRELFGPVFRDTVSLWNWQRENLYKNQ